jgi:DNA polymerase bacteriophage-type
MRTVTIDFETAYSKEYTLGDMLTEEYVTDPRFEIIGFSYKVQDSPAVFVTAGRVDPAGANPAGFVDSANIRAELEKLDLPNSALLAHNTRFDGLILAHHFGILPKFYLDTYSLANAIVKPFTGSSSLESVAEHLKIGQKGHAVQDFKGLWLKDFKPAQLAAYGTYCNNDVELTYKAFTTMKRSTPKLELRMINRTLRMYLEPKFILDTNLLIQYNTQLNNELALIINNLPARLTKADIVSNQKFAAYLKSRGIVPDKKLTLRKNGELKETDALGKKDPFIINLLLHPDATIAAVTKARVRLKSNINEKRSERLIKIARAGRPMRIPLVYAGAHTLRWSGDESINAQNLPKKSGNEPSLIRRAFLAPANHTVITADLSQIEARLVAYVAGEQRLVNSFAAGGDVYSEFATRVYGVEVNKENYPDKRFVGKTAILSLGYGAGHVKLGLTLLGYGVKTTQDECMKIVSIYRDTYSSIRKLWRTMQGLLEQMHVGALAGYPFTPRCNLRGPPVFWVNRNAVTLPNGASLLYPGIRIKDNNFVYGDNHKLYGGKFTENIVQALARLLLAEYIIALENQGLNIVHTVHDELIFIEKDNTVDSAKRIIRSVMTQPPKWAATLPVDVEIKTGKSYGECKQ